MVKEDTYQGIEDRIRKQLGRAKNLKVKASCLEAVKSGDSRRDILKRGLTGMGISLCLARTKSLLNKLPENYHAFNELKNLYLKLK